MKFKNLKVNKLEEFFNVINNCKGNVYLISPDMNINLKSRMAQYISLANLCATGNEDIKQIEIVANEREDIDKLIEFMSDGEK